MEQFNQEEAQRRHKLIHGDPEQAKRSQAERKQQEKEHKAWLKRMQDFKDKKFRYESQLEDYFCRKVKEAGGWSIKFNSVGTNGLPDQIIFYKSLTWMVELKMPKGTVQEHQKLIHKRFSAFGHRVRIVRSKEDVAEFITDMLQLNLN